MQARWPVRNGRRLVAGAVAVAVIAAGIWWVRARIEAETRFASVSSSASVIGTWKLDETSQIRFTADGRFTATDLPEEVFDDSDDLFSGGGTWSLRGGGGSVSLVADHPPSGMPQEVDPSLAVVRSSNSIQLCIMGEAPGVLCDYLLRRVATH